MTLATVFRFKNYKFTDLIPPSPLHKGGATGGGILFVAELTKIGSVSPVGITFVAAGV
jgi:hypothetical protein